MIVINIRAVAENIVCLVIILYAFLLLLFGLSVGIDSEFLHKINFSRVAAAIGFIPLTFYVFVGIYCCHSTRIKIVNVQ